MLQTEILRDLIELMEEYILNPMTEYMDSDDFMNAVYEAMQSVKNEKIETIPPHLQDAHYKGAAKLGHGIGYKYAHDYPNHYVEQQYLPDELTGTVFYEPGDLGYEKTMKERINWLRSRYRK